jgi:hypothetical protein
MKISKQVIFAYSMTIIACIIIFLRASGYREQIPWGISLLCFILASMSNDFFPIKKEESNESTDNQ